MFEFLFNLRDRLRAHNKRKWDELRGKRDGFSNAKPNIWDERYEEFKNKPMPEPGPGRIEREQQAYREHLQSGKSKIQKKINWFIAPLAVVLAFIIIETRFWPAPEIQDFLAGMGFRGQFFVFLPIGLGLMVLLAIPVSILTSILVRKEMKSESQNNSGSETGSDN